MSEHNSDQDKNLENLTDEEKIALIEELQKTNFALEQQILASNQAYDGIITELEEKNNEAKTNTLKLKELNNFFSSVSDVMSGLLVVTDMSGKITSINRAVEVELGHNVKDLIGASVDALFNDQDLADLDMQLQGNHKSDSIVMDYALEKAEFQQEMRFQSGRGGQYYQYYSVSGAPLFSKKGKQIGCVLSAFSVHDRKKKEEELIQSEEKFRLTTDSANEAIVLINSKGLITYWNKGAERVFGFTEEEMLGQDLHDRVIPMADKALVIEGLHEFTNTGRGSVVGITRDVHAQRKNGEVFPCEVSVNAVNLDYEWHAVGIIRDITDRKNAEKALMEAKREAERANQAKGMFLANMSHEIRTPMNGIIGMTQLALKTHLDAKQKSYLDKIKFSSETLLNIINDILDYSKIEAGMLDLESVHFSLHEVLENVRSLIEVKTEEKGIQFDIQVSRNTPTDLFGDPVRITQILLNLCSNGVKFTETGEVKIRIRVLKRVKQKIFIQFDVMDTGIGISKEYQKKMFQSFTQQDLSTTRKYGGTGLGLSISKKLVSLMNGDIWCNSVEGQGTTFSFTAELEAAKVLSHEQAVDCQFKNNTQVLIIDDDSNAQQIYKLLLEGMGASVEIAHGEAAIKTALAKQGWQAILLDLNMPELSGYDVVNYIEQNHGALMERVIIQTAYGKQVDKNKLINIADSHILSKPVDPQYLFNVINGEDTVALSDLANHQNKTEDILNGKRVLLVDDNEINRLVATELLDDLKLVVEEACDGKEAVDKVLANEYDFVLMDIQMPVMDGIEATRTILKSKPDDHPPIIAMTAHVMKEEVEGFLKAGMVGHVGKPIDVEVLKDVMASVLQ